MAKLSKTFSDECSDLLKSRSTENLCDLFDLTEKEPMSQPIADVRGAIMGVLQVRDPEAFSRWIEEGYDASPRVYFLQVH